MNLSYIWIILGTFLFLDSANAMEILGKDQLKTAHPVKVRIWEEGHQSLENSYPTISSHISFETDKYYMSMHLYAKILERFKCERKGTQDPTTCCFAIYNFKTDQEQLGDPKETYILPLNTQPMNALWERLTNVVSVKKWSNFEHDNHIGYVFLENVIYDDGLKMKSKDNSSVLQSTDESKKLYFNNSTLLKGLLYAGGIRKIQHHIKYFKSAAGTTSTDIFSSYDDVITHNTHIIKDIVTIQDLEDMVKLAVKHQTLLKIEEEIQKIGMPYLNTHHKAEIVNRVLVKGQEFWPVCAYLQQLKSTYENDQSYFSFNGWYNYFSGEWK